jgi:hypothetical protein
VTVDPLPPISGEAAIAMSGDALIAAITSGATERVRSASTACDAISGRRSAHSSSPTARL